MVRRWSSINSTNTLFCALNNFEKFFKIINFKNSIVFKRFTFKKTKFKRKSLIRLKHKTNWLPYSNVFKLWVWDYGFTKHYAKFQFFYKFTVNNFLFYNFNFIKNSTDLNSMNFNFYFLTFSKKSFLYFYKKSFYPYPGYSNIFFGWYLMNISKDISIVPATSQWEDSIYQFNNKLINFDLNLVFDFFLYLTLKKNLEIRKILTLLFYFNINNFKNVK